MPFRQVGDRFDSLGDLAQLVIESEADIGEEGTSPGGCAIWRARAKASFGAFEFRSACFGGWTCKTAGVTPPLRRPSPGVASEVLKQVVLDFDKVFLSQPRPSLWV